MVVFLFSLVSTGFSYCSCYESIDATAPIDFCSVTDDLRLVYYSLFSQQMSRHSGREIIQWCVNNYSTLIFCPV